MTSNEMTTYQFHYDDAVIRGTDDDFVSLTDMWRAVGQPDNKRPIDWSRGAMGAEFVAFIGENLKVGNSHVECFRIVRGGDSPGTWAHWQIAIAYAKYLSPAFHAWCNTVVREKMTPRAVASPSPHPQLALYANPRLVGDSVECTKEIRCLIGAAASRWDRSWRFIHGDLRSELGVVGYRQIPFVVVPIAKTHLLGLIDGTRTPRKIATELTRGHQSVGDPRQTSFAWPGTVRYSS